MVNFRPQTVGALRDSLEAMPDHAPVHVHVSIPAAGTRHRAPLLSVHTKPDAVELGGAVPPAERLDISGRDPDDLTPIEVLAFAYPDVYALMLERDEALARVAVLERCPRDVPGDAVLTRHDDGRITVQHADPVIAVAPEVLEGLVVVPHLEDDGTLVLDTAGEYRYQRVGEQEIHGRTLLIYRRVQGAGG